MQILFYFTYKFSYSRKKFCNIIDLEFFSIIFNNFFKLLIHLKQTRLQMFMILFYLNQYKVKQYSK